MFNTQKSDDRVNTEKYRNSKLNNNKKYNKKNCAGIGLESADPQILWYRIGSEKMVSLHPLVKIRLHSNILIYLLNKKMKKKKRLKKKTD